MRFRRASVPVSSPDRWDRRECSSRHPTRRSRTSRTRRLRDIYAEQARALVEGGVDLLLLETMQDLLELKAAIAGIRREFARGMRRVPIQAQPTLITGRADAARNRHPRDLRRSRCTRGRGRRSELFDGPGANARLYPLPLRERARIRQRDSECRSSTRWGPPARRSISKDRRSSRTSSPPSCGISASTSSADAAERRRLTSVRCAMPLTQSSKAPTLAAGRRRSRVGDHRRGARAGASPADRRRAHQLARLAKDQTAALRGSLRRYRAGRPRTGRRRRTSPRRLLRSHRTSRRRRADAPARATARAIDRSAARHRFDRTASPRNRPTKLPRPRDPQLGAPRIRTSEDRRGVAVCSRTRRCDRGVDHRRDWDGENGGSQSSRLRGGFTRSLWASTVFRPARSSSTH